MSHGEEGYRDLIKGSNTEGSNIDADHLKARMETLPFYQRVEKEGVFDKVLSKRLDKAYRLRENADYKDFEIISRDMAKEQMERAEKIMDMIKSYLDEKWKL